MADRRRELVTRKDFLFTCSQTPSISVKIDEKCDPDYGLFTWPAANVLADFIFQTKEQFEGKTILELGGGTGLCGIVAALSGAKVTITDRHSLLKKSNLLEENVKLNGLPVSQVSDESSVRVCPLTWGIFTEDFPNSQFDYIIASDCFYDPKDFENIIATVSYLFSRSPNAIFFTAYQLRDANWNIECLLRQWKIACEAICHTVDPPQNSNSDHTILLFKMTKSF